MFKFDFDVEADSASSKFQTSPETVGIDVGLRSSDAPDEYAEISLIELVRILILCTIVDSDFRFS